MKLYYISGTCSLSPHIALREAGLSFSIERVDRRTKKLSDGRSYTEINPKGYVPLLELDDGRMLSEAAVIVQYIADLKPEAKLAPPAGTFERYRLQEWLNFIATEVHKTFGTLFNPSLSGEARESFKSRLSARLELVDKTLQSQPYLMGDRWTVPDGYLFTVLRWAKRVDLDLTPWKGITAFIGRMEARPAVQAALAADELR